MCETPFTGVNTYHSELLLCKNNNPSKSLRLSPKSEICQTLPRCQESIIYDGIRDEREERLLVNYDREDHTIPEQIHCVQVRGFPGSATGDESSQPAFPPLCVAPPRGFLFSSF